MGLGGYTRRDPPAPGPLSVSVNVQVRQFNAGDYANLVADAGGQFHAFWIDNRTGKPQIWTAPITVDAVAAKFGGGTLADFGDITSKVTLDLTNSFFDRTNNTVVVSAQLENRSKDTLVAPIKGRVVSLSSAIANTIRLSDAASGDGGPASVVDFSDVIDGGVLRPDEKSRPKRLTFKLSDLVPMRVKNEFRGGLVSMQMTILSKRNPDR